MKRYETTYRIYPWYSFGLKRFSKTLLVIGCIGGHTREYHQRHVDDCVRARFWRPLKVVLEKRVVEDHKIKGRTASFIIIDDSGPYVHVPDTTKTWEEK